VRYLPAVGLFLALIASGCSSISIIPRPATPGAIVNPSDQSIKINNSGLTVSARVQDTAVGGYDIETALAAFYLTLNNKYNANIDVSLEAFTLVDTAGNSHSPIAPEEVNAILNPEIGQFLPYPFVGYYDVVDLEQHRASSAMASERPYIGSGLPAVDELTPLPVGSLAKGQQVSGMLYFNIEIIDESVVDLRAELPVDKNKSLSYSFPFSIEK
jgi:hypothetical protein